MVEQAVVEEDAAPDETMVEQAVVEEDAAPAEMIAFGQPPKPHERSQQELASSADGDTNGALAPSDLPANVEPIAEPDQLALEVPHHAGQNGKPLEPHAPESTSATERPAAVTTAQKQRQPRTKRRKSS
jgi:hypothetical protein